MHEEWVVECMVEDEWLLGTGDFVEGDEVLLIDCEVVEDFEVEEIDVSSKRWKESIWGVRSVGVVGTRRRHGCVAMIEGDEGPVIGSFGGVGAIELCCFAVYATGTCFIALDMASLALSATITRLSVGSAMH